MILIGLMGTIGAGKDVVSDYLVENHGFEVYRSGDICREIAEQRGIEPTRENLQGITDEMYAKHGKTFFVDEILRRIRGAGVEKAIFNGVRNPIDAKVPMNELGEEFVLVLVDAKPEIRFERLKTRARPGFPKNLEEFRKHEDREYALFNMRETFSLPHRTVNNNSSLKDLYSQVEELVGNLGI